MNPFLHLPGEKKITAWYSNKPKENFYRVNGHVHTPCSFSAFESLQELFTQAAKENIKVLGINDFYVTDGYHEFGKLALENRIFPLFNIEFIGLMKEKQQAGIRINDPNNPGRIYFCGKGLDVPFRPGFPNRLKLKKLCRETQRQIREMIARVNGLLQEIDPSFQVSYDGIRKELAKDLVRERHIAKALRIMADKHFPDAERKQEFLRKLFGGKEPRADLSNAAELENEIRSSLLKAGGRAFVPEDESSFLPVQKIIQLILRAGGIPCYPVLLDDAAGKYTEFESDKQQLMNELLKLNVRCIELIPARNDIIHLTEFVQFFHRHGFVVLFGTEHNAPGAAPLDIMARKNTPLSEELLKINYEGACIIAAHEYLRSQKQRGYVFPCGNWAVEKKESYAELGRAVINYFISE